MHPPSLPMALTNHDLHNSEVRQAMGFFDRFRKDGVNVVERLELGSIVIDLRKFPAAALVSGVGFQSVRKQLARVGPPSQLLVWIIPVAAFNAPEEGSGFVKRVLEFLELKTDSGARAQQCAVLAGTGPGIRALAYLLRSAGMGVFAIGPDDPAPLVELRTAAGQPVRGMLERAAYPH